MAKSVACSLGIRAGTAIVLELLVRQGAGEAGGAQVTPSLNNTSQLRALSPSPERLIRPIQLEGVVLFADKTNQLLAVHDDSGEVLFHGDFAGPLRAGDRVVLQGDCEIDASGHLI